MTASRGIKGATGGQTTPSIGAGAPANDECTGAIPLACDGATLMDNTDATTNNPGSATDPFYDCHNGGPTADFFGSVWGKFTPGEVEAIISTCNSVAQDSLLNVFTGTCGNLTVIGCSDDVTGCAASNFNSLVALTGLTPTAELTVQLSAWTASDQGSYTVDVVCGVERGACCVGTMCNDNASPAECFDAGGVWQGFQSTCVDVLAAGFCVAPPACPPGGIVEAEPGCGQPSPDNFNSGCAGPSAAFFDLPGDGCGATICGEATADDRGGSNRDTDWYRFTPLETQLYTACVTAQFFPQVQFWRLNPGPDPCAGTTPENAGVGNPGAMVCATQCLVGGNPYVVRVTTVDVNGDAQRRGIGCSDYVLTISCDVCVLGACCTSANMCEADVAESECIAAGGEYLGDDSTCMGVTCGGACCMNNGTCMEAQSRVNCIDAQGSYGGLGSTCMDVEPCPVCVFEDPNDLDFDGTMNEDCSILGVDFVNSGCTSGAPGDLFSVIECNETVCGTAAYDGAFRDLDWYHFSTPAGSPLQSLIELENQMAEGTMIWRLQWRTTQVGVPACDAGFNFITEDAIPPGSTFYSIVLSPGQRYTLLAAYDFNPSVGLPPVCPTGGRYRLTINCEPDTCSAPCDPMGATLENEPLCADGGNLNPGCFVDNVSPASMLTLGQKACGTTRLVPTTTATRDLDAWQINIPAMGDYTFRYTPEFESFIFLQPLDGPMNCDDPSVFGFRLVQCTDFEVQVLGLEAGNYQILVFPDFAGYTWSSQLGNPTQEPCGTPYTLEVLGSDPCAGTICADSNCDGSVTVSDIAFFVNAVTGGAAGWNALFPGGVAPCDFVCANDTSGDGNVTVSDIAFFVQAITSGGCQ